MENHRDILCLYLTPRPHGIDPPAPMWYTIIVQFGPLPRYEKKIDRPQQERKVYKFYPKHKV